MNRNTQIIISVSVSLAIVVSLSLGLPLYYHYSSIFYPESTIISYELNPEAGEEWTLNASFIFGLPCVKAKNPIVEFSKRQDYTVVVTFKVKLQRVIICPGIMVEWNYLFKLVFPQPGNWTVHCNDKKITVYVQEPCYC
ncbi:MAG: hypothetical protein ACXAAM_01025 [Candidatus Heimdallarchaeaceae archaeon]